MVSQITALYNCSEEKSTSETGCDLKNMVFIQLFQSSPAPEDQNTGPSGNTNHALF